MIAAGAVALTYPHIARTADEASHINNGMQWWGDGEYTRHRLNPPLARVTVASLVYSVKPRDYYPGEDQGRERYQMRLTMARIPVLPFFILSAVLMYLWGRRLFDNGTALCATALYVTLPCMLGHAGLATTDVVFAAMALWVFMETQRWIEAPSIRRSLWLGAALGFAIGSKFSILVYWPAALVLVLSAQALVDYRCGRPLHGFTSEHFARLVLWGFPPMLLVLGCIYRFHYEDLVQGLMDLYHDNKKGFTFHFMGHPPRAEGIWYFFPAVFLFKTPLAFQLLMLLGSAGIIRKAAQGDERWFRRLVPLLCALGVLIPSMSSNINVGIRHILSLYPLLALPAGYALHRLWKSGYARRGLAALLLSWQVAACAYAYPGFIAYYNELAGPNPEYISLDSDFDWGQNIKLLGEELDRRNIREVRICVRRFVNTRESIRFSMDARDLGCPGRRKAGWLALGHSYALVHPDRVKWLQDYQPVMAIDRTMDLYYIPEEGAKPAPQSQPEPGKKK